MTVTPVPVRPGTPRRLRRSAGLVAPLLLALPLAACGGDSTALADETQDGLAAVSVEGDVGSDPEITWSSRMTADAADVETLVEGDGDAVEEGDTALVNFVLANGWTQETAVDTFGEEASGYQLTLGGESVQPASVADVVASFLEASIPAGTTKGSRLTITVSGINLFQDAIFSEPVGAADIGNEDGLLVVADVLDADVLDGPEGETQQLPAWAPSLEFAKGVPSGLDFSDADVELRQTRKAFVKQGTGTEVEKGDLIVVDYLGQLADANKPFDESFSGGEPFATGIGLGNVVQGWDDLLVGVPVGSRVILEIKPGDGYGAQGSGDSIPGGSTLFFVVDVLAAV
ncbi:MAG: hypothetical protein CMH83_10315 [Nocardioides sp.]|nr:hypothetical protein [Nocardioides sp.]